MIYYFNETFTGLLLICFLGFVTVYLHFIKKNQSLALGLLILTAFILRLFMIQLDPFLNDWDERYHALVAKNIMEFPFKPMLRTDPVLPFKVFDWSNNHIWVHKQPLFLWQMALSMKIFGVSEFAFRLPSAIMGAASVYFVYQIASMWIKNKDVSFIASLLYAFAYWHLEMCSGRFGLDHNDLCFAFYFTAGIWSFLKYIDSDHQRKWAIWIGVFIGAAVLVKWLTAFLLFGGWGLYILQKRFKLKYCTDLVLAIITSVVIFMPWQIYISQRFPIETGFMHEHNYLHIVEALGANKPDPWYHIINFEIIYHSILIYFIPFGIWHIFSEEKVLKIFNWISFAMILVIYLFFSLVVQTKMLAYPIILHSIFWILMACGIIKLKSITIDKWALNYQGIIMSLLCVGLILLNLKPKQISKHRSDDNDWRNSELHNAQIYKNLDPKYYKDRVILNVKGMDDTELMFHQDAIVYHWYPPKSAVDSLLEKGYKISAFIDHNHQPLPDYIKENDEILLIPHILK